MSTRFSPAPLVKKMSSCVRPGVREVRASALRPVSALIRLDLPTFERPAKAISVPRIGGSEAAAFLDLGAGEVVHAGCILNEIAGRCPAIASFIGSATAFVVCRTAL